MGLTDDSVGGVARQEFTLVGQCGVGAQENTEADGGPYHDHELAFPSGGSFPTARGRQPPQKHLKHISGISRVKLRPGPPWAFPRDVLFLGLELLEPQCRCGQATEAYYEHKAPWVIRQVVLIVVWGIINKPLTIS